MCHIFFSKYSMTAVSTAKQCLVENFAEGCNYHGDVVHPCAGRKSNSLDLNNLLLQPATFRGSKKKSGRTWCQSPRKPLSLKTTMSLMEQIRRRVYCHLEFKGFKKSIGFTTQHTTYILEYCSRCFLNQRGSFFKEASTYFVTQLLYSLACTLVPYSFYHCLCQQQNGPS